MHRSLVQVIDLQGTLCGRASTPGIVASQPVSSLIISSIKPKILLSNAQNKQFYWTARRTVENFYIIYFFLHVFAILVHTDFVRSLSWNFAHAQSLKTIELMLKTSGFTGLCEGLWTNCRLIFFIYAKMVHIKAIHVHRTWVNIMHPWHMRHAFFKTTVRVDAKNKRFYRTMRRTVDKS